MSIFPKWLKEFRFSDMWTGVKADVVSSVKHIGTGVQSTLGGVMKIFTPTIIWLVVIAVVGLIIFKKYKKVLGL